MKVFLIDMSQGMQCRESLVKIVYGIMVAGTFIIFFLEVLPQIYVCITVTHISRVTDLVCTQLSKGLRLFSQLLYSVIYFFKCLLMYLVQQYMPIGCIYL